MVGAGRGGARFIRPPPPVPDDPAVGRRGRLRLRRALVGGAAPTSTATSGSTGRRACCCSTAGRSTLPGSDRFDIRLMAALWSCAIAVVLGLLITRLAGRRAGAAAALLSGLLSTAPVIEGFTANGELMATLPALIALALTARWQVRGGLRLMFAAGLFAGAGVPRQAVGLRRRPRGRDLAPAGGLARLAPGRRGAARARGARARRRADRRRGGAARRADRASTTGGSRSPTTASRSRASRPARSPSSCSLFTDSLRTAGPVVGMLVALALPGLWLALRRPETALAGDLVRALADRLRARRPVPRPLLRRAADAALRARRARRSPQSRRGSGSRSGWLRSSCPIYKAWPAYTPGGIDASARWPRARTRASSPTAPSAATCTRTRARATRVYAIYADASLYLAAGPALALPVPLVPRHRAHPGRAAAPARHARGPGRAALHRGLPAAAHDRQARADSIERDRCTRRYRHVATIDGRADLAPARAGTLARR